MKKTIFLVSFLFILLNTISTIHAQSRGGMLQGTVTEEQFIPTTILVTDSTTGKQLPKQAYIRKVKPIKGARIELKGTGIGAATDTTGKYFIQGIPRGLYDILYSADGFKSDLFQSVFIKRDTITEIDISLERNETGESEIAVMANRFEQKLQNVPASVSLLDPGFITRQNHISVDEGLRYVPGVSFSGPAMNIRASGGASFSGSSQTALFLDNQPIMSSALGDIEWNMFPTDFLEQVEVIKGGASTLHGPGALNGVVNLITPIRAKSHTTLRTYGGFYDLPSDRGGWTDKTRLLGGGEISHAEEFGDFNVYGSVGRFTDEGYRENSGTKRWRLFSKSTYSISTQSALSLIASFAEENRGGNMRWASLDTPLLDGDSLQTIFYSSRLLIAPSYKSQLSRLASFLARGRYLRSNINDTQGRSYKENQFGLETQAIVELGSGYSFTGGIEGNHSDITSAAFSNHQSSGFGLYLQSESPLIEPVLMTYGFRYDGQWIDDGQYLGELSPRIAANVTISETSALRASLNRGVRFPSLAERFGSPLTLGLPIAPNNDLNPELSTNYEVGYRYSRIRPVSLASWLKLDKILFDAAFYYNRYSDLIEPVRIAGDSLQLVNTNRARIWGFDVSSTFEFNSKQGAFSLGYTYANPENEETGKALSYRSHHQVYSMLLLNYGIFSFEWNYRFIGKFAASDPELAVVFEKYGTKNAAFSANAHVLDMRVGARLPYGISVNLLAKNILDEKYVEHPATLALPRQFILQLSAEL